MKSSKSKQWEREIRIDPFAFYRPKEVTKVFALSFVNHLRAYGLRAIGDCYSGKEILQAAKRMWKTKKRERAREEELKNENAERSKANQRHPAKK